MLPGFRFLFAAVVLSMSILIFGLGAAALLRTAHEEFANLPTRRVPPEPVFPRPNDSLMPTLALLRVDPAVAEKPTASVPAAAAPEIAPDRPATAEQVPEAASAEPEKLAALKLEEPVQAEAAKPEIPAMETQATSAEKANAPAANTEVKLGAIAETPVPSVATASLPAEPAMDRVSPESNIATTRIATLGGPAVTVDEKTVEGTADAKPDRSTVSKQAAQRARERRRMAARRVRLAREAAFAVQQQKAPNPFEQGLFAPVTVRR